MSTLLVAIASFVGFIVAYNTYGRWLSKKIFVLDSKADVPSKQLCDDVDFVPSKRSLVFGHHFTSIAGTGPIVGPAIAVFWGWLPALLWVLFGSIFIGAVHDFGALVVSLRNRGQTVGEIAGRLISPRAKMLFLVILFFALTIVLAIFGLVIASIFAKYPESVLPVWISLPLAVIVGKVVRKRPSLLLPTSLIALAIIYVSIYVGAYYLPITLPVKNPVVVWTIILLIYCAIASVLPVWVLLQPRDYINSQQLLVAMALLAVGLLAASIFSTDADLVSTAPAVVEKVPAGAPPIFPFLFITIACGAISGFHCLVSSGTSSKQISCETDACSIGYGAMLLEGALAVVVILACCAGTGMGKFDRKNVPVAANSFENSANENALLAQKWTYQQRSDEKTGAVLVGNAAWKTHYNSNIAWSDFRLGNKVGAFVEGGANFLTAIKLGPNAKSLIPIELAICIIAVLVACFAATTLDTATRLERYVIQEIGSTIRIPPLTNRFVATGIAVVLGGAIAMLPGAYTQSGAPIYGSGGLILWPLFGAINQLLAGLALMVTVFYLWRRNKPIWFAVIPMLLMILLPFWALTWELFNTDHGWLWNLKEKWLLASIGGLTLALQVWMVVEAILMWPYVKGVLEEALPPLKKTSRQSPGAFSSTGGRSC